MNVATNPLPQITSPSWSARTKRVVALICVLLIGLTFWRLSEALPMVVVAMILAYLLYPLTNSLSARPGRFGLPRGLAVLLTFVVVVLIIIIFILVIIPALVLQFGEFAERIPESLVGIEAELERILSQPLTFNNEPILIDGRPFIPLEQIRAALGTEDIMQPERINLTGIAETILNSISNVSRPVFSFLGSAFSAIINTVFFLTMLFYLLKDGGLFVARLVEVAPNSYRNDTRRMLYELGQVWNSYLRGQLILCLFIGTLTYIVASVLGVPNPLVLGLIAGVLEFIPNIGPTIALIPAALLALFSQSTTIEGLQGVGFAIVVIIAWIGIQNVEAVIAVPRVMGDNLNLHPFVILLAVLAGASLAGALGVVLAAPFAATIRLIGQYIYGKLSDTDPFPVTAPGKAAASPPSFPARLIKAIRERFFKREPAAVGQTE